MGKRTKAITLVAVCLTQSALALAQEQSRQLKGGGHLLGETAEQFYSEGNLGDVSRACQSGDWKTVGHLLKSEEHSSRINAKDFCADLVSARQQAAGGARIEYKGSGDPETMRADTFTFDGGHLVKIEMVYGTLIAPVEGYHPKSYGELFAGLLEAYGTPTKTFTEPVTNIYGVRSEAHRALWMGEKDVISIVEQPGANGWTEIIAMTSAEYLRAQKAPKAENPLQ
jgi:hypothetical protein